MRSIKYRIKSWLLKKKAKAIDSSLNVSNDPALDILFKKLGYQNSRETKLPSAADGSPLPWYTYPAIEYLNQIQGEGLKIFEYGSGNSSLFWARKGAQVWSVEHDQNWYKTMKTRSHLLKQLYLRETVNEYASTISEIDEIFDIVIIDGAWRNECARATIPFLHPTGIIVLDNSDWYQDVSNELKGQGFCQVDFNGFGPINSYCWTTSILFRFQSHLNSRMAHPRPIGGIEVSKSEKW